MSTNPWDPDFKPAALDPNLVQDVQSAVAAGEQVAGQVAGTVVSDATQAVESAVTGAVVSPLPPSITVTGTGGGGGGGYSTIPASSVTGLGQTLEQVIEAAAKGSAKTALESLAPSLEAELAKEFQNTVTKVVDRATGGSGTDPVPNLEDFVHADARSRAFRTLLLGLGIAVLTGLGTVAGQLAGTDWSTHNGQVAAGTLAIGAVITSLGAYFSRLISEPNVTKPLTSQLPQKASSS